MGAPSAPAMVEVASANRQLIVLWSAPSSNGSTVTGFKLRYCDASGSCNPNTDTDWITRSLSGASRRTYTISSLTNDTQYRVQLLTTSRSKGDSDWSTDQSARAGGPSAPSTPRLTVGNMEITVTWSAPAKNHSDITRYEVAYCNDTDDDCTDGINWRSVFHTDLTDLSETLTSLTDGNNYKVRVRAENTQGSGAWSSSATARPTT